jgi:hypothetical protein
VVRAQLAHAAVDAPGEHDRVATARTGAGEVQRELGLAARHDERGTRRIAAGVQRDQGADPELGRDCGALRALLGWHALTVAGGAAPAPASRYPRPVRQLNLPASLAGAAALGAGYAVARRLGLTTADLAGRIAPSTPILGRLSQLATGVAACTPAARTGSLRYGALAGAASGAVAALKRRSRGRELAVDLALHSFAGALTARVAEQLRAQRAQAGADAAGNS